MSIYAQYIKAWIDPKTIMIRDSREQQYISDIEVHEHHMF